MNKFIFCLIGFTFCISTSYAYVTDQITSTTSIQSLSAAKSCVPKEYTPCRVYTNTIIKFINYLMICNALDQLEVIFTPDNFNTFTLTSDPNNYCKVIYRNPTLKKPIICSFSQLDMEVMSSPKTNDALTTLNSTASVPDDLLKTVLRPIYDCIHKSLK